LVADHVGLFCRAGSLLDIGTGPGWLLAALNEVHRLLKAGGHALVYDLVRKLPPSVAEAARREFGSLQTRMLWLHSFEEPFYSPRDMEALVPATSFQRGQTQFVGVLCCLVLQKPTTAPLP
jgi:SAM-dependent methyltransferase